VSPWPLFGRVSLSLSLVALLAAPASAFEEKASTGSVGSYAVPDDPGVVCSYEDNPGGHVDELDRLRIKRVTVKGPKAQQSWVGYRYIVKANEKPYADGVFKPVYKSPVAKAQASKSRGVTFKGKYLTQEVHRSDFQVQLVFLYYAPGSKTKVAGKTRGLIEVYRQLGLEAGVLENGEIGDPGFCGHKVHG
jgi:hypothetical protein